MKKPVRLYNVMFPIWFFFLMPSLAWALIIPANFAIDSLVLALAMAALHCEGRADIWKHSILRIWGFGFLCDIVGSAVIFGLMMLIESTELGWDLYHFPGTTLLSIPGVIVSGALIYFLNSRFSFKKCGVSADQARRLSAALAVFTAPYAMLIPLYG